MDLVFCNTIDWTVGIIIKMNNIFKNISKDEITDVLIGGYVDNENDLLRFYPDFRVVSIEFGTTYLTLESVDQYSLLKFTISGLFEYNLEIDEDMQRTICSIRDIVLDNPDALDNRINEIIIYDRNKSDTCAAMEIKLVNGQMIFIDPSFLFGINIGGERKKRNLERKLSQYR